MPGTVYIPRDERWGELGRGLAQGTEALIRGLQRQREQEEQQKAMQAGADVMQQLIGLNQPATQQEVNSDPGVQQSQQSLLELLSGTSEPNFGPQGGDKNAVAQQTGQQKVQQSQLAALKNIPENRRNVLRETLSNPDFQKNPHFTAMLSLIGKEFPGLITGAEEGGIGEAGGLGADAFRVQFRSPQGELIEKAFAKGTSDRDVQNYVRKRFNLPINQEVIYKLAKAEGKFSVDYGDIKRGVLNGYQTGVGKGSKLTLDPNLINTFEFETVADAVKYGRNKGQLDKARQLISVVAPIQYDDDGTGFKTTPLGINATIKNLEASYEALTEEGTPEALKLADNRQRKLTELRSHRDRMLKTEYGIGSLLLGESIENVLDSPDLAKRAIGEFQFMQAHGQRKLPLSNAEINNINNNNPYLKVAYGDSINDVLAKALKAKTDGTVPDGIDPLAIGGGDFNDKTIREMRQNLFSLDTINEVRELFAKGAGKAFIGFGGSVNKSLAQSGLAGGNILTESGWRRATTDEQRFVTLVTGLRNDWLAAKAGAAMSQQEIKIHTARLVDFGISEEAFSARLGSTTELYNSMLPSGWLYKRAVDEGKVHPGGSLFYEPSGKPGVRIIDDEKNRFIGQELEKRSAKELETLGSGNKFQSYSTKQQQAILEALRKQRRLQKTALER